MSPDMCLELQENPSKGLGQKEMPYLDPRYIRNVSINGLSKFSSKEGTSYSGVHFYTSLLVMAENFRHADVRFILPKHVRESPVFHGFNAGVGPITCAIQPDDQTEKAHFQIRYNPKHQSGAHLLPMNEGTTTLTINSLGQTKRVYRVNGAGYWEEDSYDVYESDICVQMPFG